MQKNTEGTITEQFIRIHCLTTNTNLLGIYMHFFIAREFPGNYEKLPSYINN